MSSLPEELWNRVFAHLPLRGLLDARACCKTFLRAGENTPKTHPTTTKHHQTPSNTKPYDEVCRAIRSSTNKICDLHLPPIHPPKSTILRLQSSTLASFGPSPCAPPSPKPNAPRVVWFSPSGTSYGELPGPSLELPPLARRSWRGGVMGALPPPLGSRSCGGAPSPPKSKRRDYSSLSNFRISSGSRSTLPYPRTSLCGASAAGRN